MILPQKKTTQRITVQLSAAVFFAFLLLFGNQAKADITVETPTETDTLEFTINTATIDSWKGVFRTSDSTNLVRPKPSLATITNAQILGVKTAKAAEVKTVHYSPAKIYDWITTIAPLFKSEAIEPELKIENKRVTTFTPPRVGQQLDTHRSTLALLVALEEGNARASVVTAEVKPKKKLSDLNDLGITELIGVGKSTFNGSPRNRRTNIAVGVKKVSGIIVKPNEEFSFNKYLGPVEAEFGFVPELVIKQTGTVPELGGGLCQVSSTTFRAAMDAGLPITQRRNHSYAVQYYAPQGTDATIYPGVIDLKFLNDTKDHILIWAYLKDPNTLLYEIYGTKDDRKVVLDKPIQYDKKSNGAMKATWTRTVTKDGVEKKDVFNSVYQPPALFHKEETFVPATPPASAPSSETTPLPTSETQPTTTTQPVQ